MRPAPAACYPAIMSRRQVVGALLLLAGIGIFVLTFRSIAWMSYGGARDDVQFGMLVLGLVVAIRGIWMLLRPSHIAAPTSRSVINSLR